MPELPFASKCFRFALLHFFLLFLGTVAIAAELRDPTRPPAISSSAPPSAVIPAGEPLELLATLVSPDRRIAIIDGQAVAEGKSIRGMQLIRVGAGEVIISQNGRERTLRVAAPQYKGFRKSDGEDHP